MGIFSGLRGAMWCRKGRENYYDSYYPLVVTSITNWNITECFMGKSTLSTGPFSIATSRSNFKRVTKVLFHEMFFFTENGLNGSFFCVHHLDPTSG